LKLRFSSADGTDKEQLAAMRNELKMTEGEGKEKEVALPDQRLIRTGAYAQMIGPQPVPLPLVGPACNDRLLLAAHLELKEGNALIKQLEDYAFTRTNVNGKTSIWIGQYTVMTESGTPAFPQRMKVVFAAHMTLVEDDIETFF